MGFVMPTYHAPDFTEARFLEAPNVSIALCDMDGVVPENYHSTSMYPEYYKIDGEFRLAEESRMDCAVILRENGALDVTGNMTPSFRVADGKVRPLFIYSVDISEFATNKLSDRGSLSAIPVVTNVQDFIVNVAKGVGVV